MFINILDITHIHVTDRILPNLSCIIVHSGYQRMQKSFRLPILPLQTLNLLTMRFEPLDTCKVLLFLSLHLHTEDFQMAGGFQPLFLQLRKTPSTSRNHPGIL